MKEQDLRDKINIEIVNYTTGLDNYSHTLDKCVQIAKDYAEKESIEFAEWLLNSQYLYELGMKTKTLTECYQLFKNRENER